MSSKRALIGSVVFMVACSAGPANDDSGGGPGSGGDDNNGGSMGTGFGDGGGGGTNNNVCTAKTCVGNSPQGNCDDGLDIVGTDPMSGAKAIGLCKVYEDGGWGVKSAQWVQSDGVPLAGMLLDGKGVLDNFGGVNPREGKAMLAISSGSARSPEDPGWGDPSGYQKMDEFIDPPHGAPPGYPKESPSCGPDVFTGPPYDSAGLRLVVQTPTDAKSFSFDFDFYTYEFPSWICSEYNDFFVAMVNPKISSLPDGNVSFDAQGNTISVNAGFLQVCTAQEAGGKFFDCPLGPGELNSTGFETHAATSWLQTKAPIEAPGSEVTFDFLIWDSGDTVLDSTTLIDNFRFELDESGTGTLPVPE
ncbi:MAG: hypothetical protein HOW73_13560 [Polyangiaceae bacterium]|nr:hypothetical protein [Polyangiaceae bacterium]